MLTETMYSLYFYFFNFGEFIKTSWAMFSFEYMSYVIILEETLGGTLVQFTKCLKLILDLHSAIA